MLPHTITIQSKVTSTDKLGGRVESWSNFLVGLKCFIQPLSQEQIAASQQRAGYSATHRIYLGSTSPDRIEPGQRVLFGSRTFTIKSAKDEGELQVFWELEAEEVNPK